MKQFQICLFLSKQNYFLKFDLTLDRTRGPTDKVSGLPSEGRRFDSRHCQFWQINFFLSKLICTRLKISKKYTVNKLWLKIIKGV